MRAARATRDAAIEAAVEALAEAPKLRRAPHEPRYGDALAGRTSAEPMTVIKILPHAELCPEGKTIEPRRHVGCEALLENGMDIEHACDMSCACTTCHVIVAKACFAEEPTRTRKTCWIAPGA